MVCDMGDITKRITCGSASFCYIRARAHSFRHLSQTENAGTDRETLKQAYSPISFPSRETSEQRSFVFTYLARFGSGIFTSLREPEALHWKYGEADSTGGG
jgi:hypothetical protein